MASLSDEDRTEMGRAMKALEDAMQTQSPADATRAAHTYADAMIGIAKRHPDDFEVQYQVGKALELLGPQVTNLGGDGAPFCAQSVAFARELAQRFDREGRAHAVLAFTLDNCDGAALDVLHEAERCVVLVDDAHCRDLHVRTAAQYTAPRCDGANVVRGLAVVSHGEPVLAPAQISAIEDSGGAAVALLTPEGRARLHAASASPGTIAVTVDGASLRAFTIDHELDTARVSLGVPIEKVCAKVERREIPVEDRLP